MSLPTSMHESCGTPAGTPRSGMMRQVVELMVSLCLCVLVVRTFSAEAYVVPTGSMAPTLLGLHHELTCGNCRFPYVVGTDDDGRTGSPVCPNCGQTAKDDASAVAAGGDRVLVQKLLYEVRRPRRWEVAVFHFPGEPSQAYVKRVVGMPGESISISSGDVFANGRIVRKSLAELRAMRLLVHDSRYQPDDSERFPRWLFQKGTRYRWLESGWKHEHGGFVHSAVDAPRRWVDDWLVYKHWDPSRAQYGPVRDFYAYNGGELRAENEVRDFAIEARLKVSDSVDSITLAIRSGSDQFLVRVPVTRQGSVEVLRNDHREKLADIHNAFEEKGLWPRTLLLEAAVCDQRVQVAIDGKPLFAPIDYDDPARGGPPTESPVALGVRGGDLEVADLRVFRDVYYTSSLANTPRHSQVALGEARLGLDQYFVLGDNSPVSNDSRFWSEGPVVQGSMFVGKPFLVHLPGQAVALKVFGRSVCWVPDPRRIRYIR
jgi:signal peptidase I